MDPELQNDINELNKLLHFENISTRNRLLSILKDCKFVSSIKEKHYPDIPIIPNERCGRWYVRDDYFENTYMPSYFKSTDGHTNNWGFSTRRLNLHLLPIIIENNGIIIVDSTRRGKKIPDSMSKTIPIWISIINKIICDKVPFHESFITPTETVSQYEHDRILDLLPEFYNDITKYLDLIGSKIKELDIGDQNIKILKPFWIYPGCTKIPIFTGDEPFWPVLLISASEKSQDGENKMNGYTYVQGAGDDHELWSRNLSPQMFWKNVSQFENIINLPDAEVNQLVDTIVLKEISKQNVMNDLSTQFWKNEDIYKVTDTLYFGKIDKNIEFRYKSNTISEFSKIIVLDSTFKMIELDENEDKEKKTAVIDQYMLDSGCKKSSKLLRFKLTEIIDRVQKDTSDDDKILVLCNNGEDLSAGVILCCLNMHNDKLNLSKETIRRDLIKLLNIKKVNPQRATLNSVNSFLLS